ncbi:unnamed protein product [Menidia menidia]|uniref:GTPase IMAP family member 8 n=1 Tax=Menidia menidia TaxID=238744 RepID=A0A8S4BM39_9TELE|nr:unnamed protein product [Menidia menidia]
MASRIYYSNRPGADLRVVLVGQERVGKSSAGNTILGKKEFNCRISSIPLTVSSEKIEGEFRGRRVSVVDTPGLCSSQLSAQQVEAELIKAVELSYPGPHVFLLTLQLGRFTPQEQRGLQTLQSMLSPEVSQHTMLLFTYGDRLEDMSMEQLIREDVILQGLLQSCSGVYHVFNNRETGDRRQVQELLDKIDSISKGGTVHYEMGAQTRVSGVWGLPIKVIGNIRKGGDWLCSKITEPGADLRVVLVGQERVGKSSAGNTILGKKEFNCRISSIPLTVSSEKIEGEFRGRRVSVVDTPGLCSSQLSAQQLEAELIKAVQLSNPGPHVFLLTLQLGRVTPQEQRGLQTLQSMLSPEVSKHTMLLFTYGDRLEDMSMEQLIREDVILQGLLRKCSGEYHVFNNRETGDRRQVQELLDKIDSISKGGTVHYEMGAQTRVSGVWGLPVRVYGGIRQEVAPANPVTVSGLLGRTHRQPLEADPAVISTVKTPKTDKRR